MKTNNENVPDINVERAMHRLSKLSVAFGIIGILLDVILVGVLFGVFGVVYKD